jgi:hypothetical protein
MIGIEETKKKNLASLVLTLREPIGKTKESFVRTELMHYEETGGFVLLMPVDISVEITLLLETTQIKTYYQHMV